MKRILALCLVFCMVVGLLGGCGAGGAGETTETTAPQKEHTLQVGFGRVDISPTESVPMEGYGNTSARMSTEVTEPLYTTCIAFTDEADNTILLFHNDLITSKTGIIGLARALVAKAVNVPVGNVMVAATHTHSGPALSNSHESIARYIESLNGWMVEAAKLAMADRKPAQMYGASGEVLGLNYVRHYVMDDGSIAGSNFGTTAGKKFVKHVCDPDTSMQLVKFVREGGEDVLLMNWQGHPHRAGGSKKTNISSDIVGVIRDNLEEELNCKFAYFTGASGDVNNNSWIAEEKITKDVYEHGDALSQQAVSIAANFKKLELGTVQLLHNDFTLESKKNNPFNINVFSIGEVVFVTAPYEMFTANGLAIKAGSPFTMTFICTTANEQKGYIPAEHAFEYNSYEVQSTNYPKGTGEALANAFVEMLQELHKTWK